MHPQFYSEILNEETTWETLYLLLYRPRGTWQVCQFLNPYTDGRTPWEEHQPVARPLPTHRINAHNTDIHALSGIRTHDPSVREGEDGS
jgi:hypothetical protein